MSSITRSSMRSGWARRTQGTRDVTSKRGNAAINLLALVLLLGVWESASRLGLVPPIILPPPSSIGGALLTLVAADWILPAILATGSAAVLGFLVASVLGIGLGTLVAHISLLRAAVFPYVVVFQLIPTVAMAPIYVIWLGPGIESKAALAFTLAFFPITVNTMSGMKQVPMNAALLMRSLGASNTQTFRMLTLPAALPYIFAGLRTAGPYALLGAMVGEFVVAREGLGYRLLEAGFAIKTDQVWATVFVISALGMTLYGSIALAHSRLVWWSEK